MGKNERKFKKSIPCHVWDKTKQQMPLTIEEIEELELLDEKYVVGDKTIENLTIALRIKELTDKCDNIER